MEPHALIHASSDICEIAEQSPHRDDKAGKGDQL